MCGAGSIVDSIAPIRSVDGPAMRKYRVDDVRSLLRLPGTMTTVNSSR